MAVSQNRGPQYRPQNTIRLIMGTPKRVPLILGKYHVAADEESQAARRHNATSHLQLAVLILLLLSAELSKAV